MTTTEAQQVQGAQSAWNTLASTLADVGEAIAYGNPIIETSLERAEGMRYIARQFALGACTEFEAGDPAYPQFFHLASSWWCYGGQNPDATYWCATLDGEHTYRMFGTRGTAYIFDLEVWAGDHVDYITNHAFGGLSDFEHGERQIEFGPDGEVEIVLSREKQPGNWCPIPEGRSWVLVRQLFYDWENEQVGDLYIERVGAQYPPPVVTEEEWTSRVTRLGQYLTNNTAAYNRAAAIALESPPNSFRFQPILIGDDTRDGTGFAGQFDGSDHYFMRQIVMGQGRYECEPDQAVIIEVPAPKTRYWNYYLMTRYWEGVSWNLRQSSLNGHQGMIDTDGVLRVVIAQRDPGVPNWLDTGGHSVGIIVGRLWQPEVVENPQVQVVPLDEIRGDFLTPPRQ